MDIDDIKKLVELMEAGGVVELEMEDPKGKIRLVRANHQIAVAIPAPSLPLSLPIAVSPPTAPVGPQSAEVTLPPADRVIASPMVGTFYRASNPEATPYVDIGTVVQKGDVVCIIEAMKMMNEIQAEKSGRIVRVLVENTQPVEYGQPLFVVEPL